MDKETILEIIKEYIEKNGYVPSIRELCELSGLSSPSSTHRYVKILEEERYIEVLCARVIKILK